ncbi:MAG: glycine cleavage system protein H [Acidobacteria bacterium]|nr:glycine cleavage system protein H [Acidobacteriota bacterium]
MVAIFVVGLVVLFLAVDLALAARGRKSIAQQLMEREEARGEHQLVGGFQLATDRAYHPGHTWARYLGEGLARVGVDDFASRLIGTPDAVELPAVGAVVRAGRPLARVRRGARRTSVVAPISGVVTAVNRELLEKPARLGQSPYSEGWMVEVKGDSLRLDLRALLSGELARRWMDESVAVMHRLFSPPEALPAAADGGRAVDGISDQMDDPTWERARSRFLLTDPD